MSNVIIMPDGTPVDITGIPEEQVVAMIEASRTSMPAPAPQKDYMTREELMSKRKGMVVPGTPLPANMAEDALVGAGRFFSEMGQGIKQKYLMATDPEKAKEYTDETIIPDRERWDKGTEGMGSEDIGYYGAMASPGAVGGGGLGVLGTGLMAGVEAGLMPVDSATWEETAKNAATAAAFGAALRFAPDLWSAQKAVRNWLKNRNIQKNLDPDMVALAEQYGVKIPRSMYSPSKAGKVAEELGQVPFVGRVAIPKMLADAKSTMEEMLRRNEPRKKIQDVWNKQKKAIEDADSNAWIKTHEAIGDAPIDRQSVNNTMEEVLGTFRGDTIGQAQVDEIRSLWRPMRQRPRFETKGKTLEDYNAWKNKWDMQDQVRGFEGDNLQALHKFRAKFGAANQASWSEKGWNPAHLNAVYEALTEEMYAAASRSYGQAGVDMLRRSVDDTTAMHRMFRNTRVGQQAQQDAIDSTSTFVKAALSGDADRMAAMKQILGKDGAVNVRNEIISDVMSTFTEKGQKAAANRLGALKPAIKTFFGDDDLAAINGLQKFMEAIPKDKMSFFSSMFRIGGATLMPQLGAAAALAPKWIARQDVGAMLQKLSTTPKDTKLYKALVNELTESAMIAGGVSQSRPVPEIDIINGVTQ